MNTKDLKVNWLPITFSREIFKTRFVPKASEDEPQEGLYKATIYKGESRTTHEVEGYFSFNNEGGEAVTVAIDVWNSRFLVRNLVLKALKDSLSNDNFDVFDGHVGLNIIDKRLHHEISPEFFVYDKYVLHSFFLSDLRDSSLVYGLAIDNQNHFEFRLTPAELHLFTHRKVRWLEGGNSRVGKLLEIESDKAIIEAKKRIKNRAEESSEVERLKIELSQVQPVGSYINFRHLCKLKYKASASALDSRLRQITGSITSTNSINQNILRDKYQTIKKFIDNLSSTYNGFRLTPDGETTFRLGNSFIGLGNEASQELSIRGGRLPHRDFRFKNNAISSLGQYQGVKNIGPVEYVEHSEDVNFLFIFPEDKRTLANTLFFALKNGLGSFPGIESFFKIPINNSNVHSIRIPLKGHVTLEQSCDAYRQTLEQYLEQNPNNLDYSKTFAFLIAPSTEPSDFPNSHYLSKALLMKYGIASQGIDEETIQSKTQFQWSIANIALAVFAKLGGVPWRIANPSQTKQLIFGVGQKQIYDDSTDSLKKVIGFTVCVTQDGQFRSTSTFEAASSLDEFVDSLGKHLEEIIKADLLNVKNIEEIIIHFPQRSNKKQVAKIEKVLEKISTTGNGVYPFAILRVIDSEPFLMWDVGHSSYLPSEGHFAKLSNKEAILVVPGRQEKRSIATVPKTPLRISLEVSTLTSTKFDQLLFQVYALSGANWRAFNAREMPITRFYSELIAKDLGYMSKYDIDFYDGLKKLHRVPWFL